MRKTLSARAARAMMALGLAAAACGCGGPGGGGDVTVLVAWGGLELAAFHTVVETFEDDNPGIQVHVLTTRGLTQQLGADLVEGAPPDVAALPSIGAIGQYAGQGALKPLDGLVDTAAYGQPWSGLMQPGHGGHVYAAPVKADVKSLIWYDPAVLHHPGYSVPPSTLTQLGTLSRSIEQRGGSPWCLALSSPPTSGWPGTDWIADILLSTFGPGTYQQWVNGTLPWTSGPVLRAWQTWGQLIGGPGGVYRGAEALTQNIGSFHPSSDGCYLAHGTLVDQGFPAPNGRARPGGFGRSYNFFPFPSSGALQVSADFIGLFNDTPSARMLVRFLTSTTAQREWVSQAGADGFSADSQVPVLAYPDPATRRIATLLTSGQELCFGASDAMPPDLSAAFDHAILAYLANPAALTSTILPELSRVPHGSSSAPAVCGMPPAAPGRH
jgi:alpha-glucoside transport system substrate-binding protein